MGLDVELIRIGQPGTGRQRDVQLAVVADTRFRLAAAVERAQQAEYALLLDRIDLYGVLELPSDQMPQLIGELDQLIADAGDEREHEVVAAVRRLAERCREDSELALRFVGD